MDPLVREYARLTPIRNLRFPSASPRSFTHVHDVLLNEILLDPHFRTYPPAPEHQLKFWKWAIQGLEALLGDEDIEIDARLYDHLVELTQTASNSQLPRNDFAPPSPSHVTHYLRLCPETPDAIHRVTLLESCTTIEQGTTGLKTWPAAGVLAEWLGKHPEHVRGKRILEFGCGVGYLGLVVSAIQLTAPDLENSNPSVWLTDVNELVLSRCQKNLELPCNASSRHKCLKFRQLDWFSALEADGISSIRDMMEEADPDFMLGADIVYDPSIIPPLIATIYLGTSANKFTRQRPVSALLALTVRRPETFGHFIEAAEKLFMVTNLYSTLVDPELGRRDGNHEQEIVIIKLDLRN